MELEYFKKIISYDPDSGLFTRLKSNNGYKVGGICGRINNCGYRVIKINKKDYMAHRLAWLFYSGQWPSQYIDHINGDKLDNRIENLREASKSENNQNIRHPKSNNTTGYLGVSYNKTNKKYAANITNKGRAIFIGSYDCPKEAHQAYLDAKRKMHNFCTI